LEVETKFRVLWHACTSREIFRRGLAGQEVPQLWAARNSRASHALPGLGPNKTPKGKVGNLYNWLVKDNNTKEELAYWIPKYLLMRETIPFAEMGNMSRSMREVASSQDKIGMETVYRGVYIQEIPHKTNFPPADVQQQIKRDGLDKAADLKTTPNNSILVDI